MEQIQSLQIYSRMAIAFLNKKLCFVEPLFLNDRVYYFNHASVQEKKNFSCQNSNFWGLKLVRPWAMRRLGVHGRTESLPLDMVIRIHRSKVGSPLPLATWDGFHRTSWHTLTRQAAAKIEEDCQQCFTDAHDQWHRAASTPALTAGIPCAIWNCMFALTFGLHSHMRVHRCASSFTDGSGILAWLVVCLQYSLFLN